MAVKGDVGCIELERFLSWIFEKMEWLLRVLRAVFVFGWFGCVLHETVSFRRQEKKSEKMNANAKQGHETEQKKSETTSLLLFHPTAR